MLSCRQLIKTPRTAYSVLYIVLHREISLTAECALHSRQPRQLLFVIPAPSLSVPKIIYGALALSISKAILFFSSLEAGIQRERVQKRTAVEPTSSATSHANSGSKNSDCKTIYKALLRLETFIIKRPRVSFPTTAWLIEVSDWCDSTFCHPSLVYIAKNIKPTIQEYWYLSFPLSLPCLVPSSLELHDARSSFHHHHGGRSWDGFGCSEIGGREYSSSASHFAELIQPSISRILPVSAVIGKQIWLSDCLRSCIFCTVYLGLHHYLRNGGRSRLEIEVGFRKGIVLSSTLLALYRYRVAYSLWSVGHPPYLLTLIFFSSNESRFDQNGVSEDTPNICRFVHLTWGSLTWGVLFLQY